MEASGAESGKIIVSAQAGFADGYAGIRDALDQLEGSLDAQVQGLQVAIVDADDAGFSGEGAVELCGCVNFHDGFHADLTAEGDEVAEKLIAESGHDKQEAVSVVRARFPDLPGIEDEVLAKDGNLYGFARIAQIFQRAAKKFSFSKY
jgi:hypothetical protein